MFTFLTVILTIISVVSAFLLVAIILMQNTKSGGGLGAVSGGVTETMFGASASSVLVKVTVWLAIVFLVSTLGLATMIGRGRNAKSIIETIPAAIEAPAAEAAPVEAAPAEAAPVEAAPAAENASAEAAN